jgi:glucose/arabinose dehydrogenase
MQLDGGGMSAKAVRIRNAIALAVNPQTGTVWAGGAGQDDLPSGHPYEFLDAVTVHGGVADYGWPDCEENRTAYASGANCSNVVVPLVEFPAYETLIGAAFANGGVYVTMHGSWHTPGGCNLPPRVAFVPMNGDVPQTSVNWSNPAAQWRDVVTGFQPGCSASTRIGRPTGIAVGPQGDLFIGDDQTGNIYRVR